MRKLFLAGILLSTPAMASEPYYVGTICTDDVCEHVDSRYELEDTKKDKPKRIDLPKLVGNVAGNLGAGGTVTISYATTTTNADGSSSTTTVNVVVKAGTGSAADDAVQ